MTSTLLALVDTSVLATPIGNDREEVYRYIDTLIKISSIAEEKCMSVCVRENISDVLFEVELFPTSEKLKEIIKMNRVEEYNSKDIFVVISKLLGLKSFESEYGIEDVSYDNPETNPEVSEIIDNTCLKNELLKSAIKLALVDKCNMSAQEQYCLFTKKSPTTTIQIKTEITEIKHNRNDVNELEEFPSTFECCVCICDKVCVLFKNINHSTLFARAKDEQDLSLAIRIALLQSQDNDSQLEKYTWEDLRVPHIGREFLKCCQKICADNAASMPSKIIEAIVKTVNGIDLKSVHSLRTGKGGSSPQRIRGIDKAKACRRDVDYEIHLHYWECKDNSIELASVVYHNDFNIPE